MIVTSYVSGIKYAEYRPWAIATVKCPKYIYVCDNAKCGSYGGEDTAGDDEATKDGERAHC